MKVVLLCGKCRTVGVEESLWCRQAHEYYLHFAELTDDEAAVVASLGRLGGDLEAWQAAWRFMERSGAWPRPVAGKLPR